MSRQRAILVAVVTALAAAGCDRPAATATLDTTPAASPLPPPGFAARTDCTPLLRWTGPEVGSRYIYRRADGSESERTIRSVTIDVVGFQYRDRSSPGHKALPTRYAVAGLLVVYPDQDAARRIDHAHPPLPAIEALSVGQTAAIPTVEFSRIKGVEKHIRFQTTVRYRACGDLTVAGRPMAVRVYDVTTARRVVAPRTGETIRSSQIAYFLSDDTGYPLAVQDQTVTVVTRIDAPPLAPS